MAVNTSSQFRRGWVTTPTVVSELGGDAIDMSFVPFVKASCDGPAPRCRASLGAYCVDPVSATAAEILASLVPPIVRHGGLRSPVAEAYAADQLLRARDQPRGHAERTEAEPEKFRHRLLAPCQLPTQRDRHAWRVGDGDRQQPQDGGMGVVVVMAHGGIVPPPSERVLRGGGRAKREEGHVAGGRGGAQGGGGGLAHRARRGAG